jgi:hypothetical protein
MLHHHQHNRPQQGGSGNVTAPAGQSLAHSTASPGGGQSGNSAHPSHATSGGHSGGHAHR